MRVKVQPLVTYRCEHCTQLLPFSERLRVPDACLRRCQGRCDWVEWGPTTDALLERAARTGSLGADGLPCEAPPAVTTTPGDDAT